MQSKQIVATALLLALTGAAAATGIKGAVHSQTTFSYACPGGLSGQIQIEKNREPQFTSTLRAWVNGAQIDQDAAVQKSLAGKNIQYVEPLCEGDTTVLAFKVWVLSTQKEGTVNVLVDKSGKVSVEP
ncbi:hypothetical protein DWG18_02330 [Lysobacter sp. TY2-98]|uniref:hypothetical protein n=1 Tax=Lysobacter sp. TY2-98 TaxID=2290922 RepID=UPI000E1FDB8D|nr:hypothetical protein [Lysobacter sp. TY2-98]AXK71237.1 hypothetical protein DWG18_02330 [Lysobacter sp. TY2-98]